MELEYRLAAKFYSDMLAIPQKPIPQRMMR
jgi:hypothetical protein